LPKWIGLTHFATPSLSKQGEDSMAKHYEREKKSLHKIIPGLWFVDLKVLGWSVANEFSNEKMAFQELINQDSRQD